MANICLTSIVIAVNDELLENNPKAYDIACLKLSETYSRIISLFENGIISLESIANEFGLYSDKGGFVNKNMTINMNGFVEDISELYHDMFKIYQSDKWRPCVQIWQLIVINLNSELGNEYLKVFYEAEEPGCEIYETNDNNFKYMDQYIIDGILLPHDSFTKITERCEFCEYFNTTSDVLSYIKENITGDVVEIDIGDKDENSILSEYYDFITDKIENCPKKNLFEKVIKLSNGRIVKEPDQTDDEFISLNRFIIKSIDEADPILPLDIYKENIGG